MAKFVVMSDLNEEFHETDLGGLTESVDAVLLAGDLGAPGDMAEVMRRTREAFDAPVYAVEGNHDLWRRGRKLRTWQKIRAVTDDKLAEMNREGHEMRVLRRGQSVVVAGTRVLGATLWTNGDLGDEPRIVIRDRIMNRMNDYRKMTIEDETRGIWRKAMPEDLFREHRADLAALLRALDTPFDGPTVVMTHHVPLAELLRPVMTSDGKDLRAAYGSDLLSVLADKRFDAWVYGHSHQPEDVELELSHGSARFVSNPRGYPDEIPEFRPVILTVDPRDLSASPTIF